jgi:predicted DsbA family dithiol-disulfide isomerase
MVTHLQNTAAELGLPFGPRSTTYNSRLAQELGKWARSLDREDQYHEAIFTAYFADGLNIGKVETLLTIVERLGLETKEAAKVLTERLYKNEVDKDWQASQVKGVTAVPTFIMGGDKVVGAQSYQVLEQLLQQNGADRRI